jgi:hypothetical protein
MFPAARKSPAASDVPQPAWPIAEGGLLPRFFSTHVLQVFSCTAQILSLAQLQPLSGRVSFQEERGSGSLFVSFIESFE